MSFRISPSFVKISTNTPVLASINTNFSTTITMTNTIEDKIKEQGDFVRKLKSDKAAKDKIDEEVAKLKALKAELAQPNKPAPNPELEAKIKEQGDLVRKLKSEKAAKDVIDEAVGKLKGLKLQLQPGAEQQGGNKLILKTAKGTRTTSPRRWPSGRRCSPGSSAPSSATEPRPSTPRCSS